LLLDCCAFRQAAGIKKSEIIKILRRIFINKVCIQKYIF
jgi:hypothetical protein